MKLIIAIGVLTLVTACSKSEGCIDESKKNPNGFCTMDYSPVCGCDDITYSNVCSAENSGVTLWSQGECK